MRWDFLSFVKAHVLMVRSIAKQFDFQNSELIDVQNAFLKKETRAQTKSKTNLSCDVF